MVVAFTGRRPKELAGYNEKNYQFFIGQLTNFLKKTYSDGTIFICGGAQGFDQLAFEAVMKLKEDYPGCKVHVYVPFKGQESRWAEDGYFGQAMYRKQLEQADYVRYISNKPGTFALMTRNKAMVGDSTEVVALLNDDDYQYAGGGTSQAMVHAHKYGRKITQLKYGVDNDGVLKIVSGHIIEPETSIEDALER